MSRRTAQAILGYMPLVGASFAFVTGVAYTVLLFLGKPELSLIFMPICFWLAWTLGKSGMKELKQRKALLAFQLPDLTDREVLESSPGKELVAAGVLPPYQNAFAKNGDGVMFGRLDPLNLSNEHREMLEDYFWMAEGMTKYASSTASNDVCKVDDAIGKLIADVVRQLNDADKARQQRAYSQLYTAMEKAGR